MASLSKKNIIIWSVDPTGDPAAAKMIIKELKIWAKHLNCDILPVSIFSKSTLSFPIETALSWKDQLQEIAQVSLTRYLKKTQTKGFLPPELFFVAALSNRKMAFEMAKYAENKNAQLIFANTRAKKTWNPFRLGGFAETLVATSRVPVLLLNPSSISSSEISSILFPTDFSLTSKKALVRLEPWAKAFNSKIVVYDQVETPEINPSILDGIGQTQVFNLEFMIKDVEKSRLKKGAEWIRDLQSQNIKSSLLVKRQRKYLATDILEAAKKNKVGLIAIASQSGPVTQALLGSVARDVLLQAHCPVLIFYRPKAALIPFTLQKMHRLTKENNMIPFKITFLDFPESDAVWMAIQKRVEKLEHFFDRIVRCEVVISCPHRHRHADRLYQLQIHVIIPGEDVIVSRNHLQDEAHRDVYIAIRDSFNAAERILQDKIRIARHETKIHEPRSEEGKI